MNVGIIGSGQLGWMTIIEGRKLPNRYLVLDEKKGPAGFVADAFYTAGRYSEFVEKCDVVTYEFEHVDGRALEAADSAGKLRPGLLPVRLKRERILEKEFLRDSGFPVGSFSVASGREEALRLAGSYERSVVKASQGGYDGKGQYFIDRDNGSPPAIDIEDRFVVEEWIDFDAEASVIASRGAAGEFRAHTPSFNLNRRGMLFYNSAPYGDFGMTDIVRRLMDRLDYVGVMGVEFFIADGRALINEFAPRVHNTGHHTLHGSSISQFEQHVRAITGLPVPEPRLHVPSGVINIIGRDLPPSVQERILSLPGTSIYWYGKEGIRRRRKVGHVNITAASTSGLNSTTKEVSSILYGDDPDSFL